MHVYSMTYQLLTASILNLAWRLVVRSQNVMNYILKNWIVKKRLFWYCSNYSTWKNNHNLHFFLNCFASSFFFFFPVLVSIIWDYLPTTSLGTKTRQTLKRVPNNNIHRPTVDSDTHPYEAVCCICHDQQTGMEQTYQICVGASK